MRILDDYAASLGASDLRAHVATHRFDLAIVGLQIAVEQGSATQALRWAERGRASHLQHVLGSRPADPRLAEALAELRIVVRDIAERRASGRTSGTLRQRQSLLERRIRDENRQRRATGGEALTLPPVAELSQSLGEAAVVEYCA